MQFQSDLAFVEVVYSGNSRAVKGMAAVWFEIEDFKVKLGIIVSITELLAF